VHCVEIALHRIVVSRCMHIGLLRIKDSVLVRLRAHRLV